MTGLLTGIDVWHAGIQRKQKIKLVNATLINKVRIIIGKSGVRRGAPNENLSRNINFVRHASRQMAIESDHAENLVKRVTHVEINDRFINAYR